MTTKTTRLLKSVLFARLGYAPHDGQVLVHRSRAQRRIVACGTRFGKSTVGVHEAIAALLAPRDKAIGWLVAPTYDLGQRIFRRVVETMKAHTPHRVLQVDARDHRIIVANFGGGRSELRAKSADNPVSLLGEALDFLIVDEAARLRGDIWNDNLGPRILDRHGWVLLLSTPDGGGWFHDEFKRARRDPDYEAWSLPTSMNPFIARDLIDAERLRLPPSVFAAQYEAQFVDVPLEVCDRCHGPRRGAMSILVFEGDEQPHLCVECGEIVHENGETACGLSADGKRTPTILIRLEEVPVDVALPE